MMSKMVKLTTLKQEPAFALDDKVFGMSEISVCTVVLYMVEPAEEGKKGYLWKKG